MIEFYLQIDSNWGHIWPNISVLLCCWGRHCKRSSLLNWLTLTLKVTWW